MISRRRRRRTSAATEPTPSDLKGLYVQVASGHGADRGESIEVREPHLLLRWLIRCEAVHSNPQPCRLPPGFSHCKNVADVFERMNATLPVMSYTNLLRFETQMATWIHQNKCSRAVLTYFSNAMYRWRGICRVHGVTEARIGAPPPLFKWLEPEFVKRGLVVPDIRKLATQIWYTAEMRPGESEWVRAIDPMATFSGASLVQKVRSIEYCNAKRHVLQYGTSDEIYTAGLLNYVYLAMIDIRLRNRIQLDWKSKCVVFPSTITPAALNTAWPFMYVTPRKIFVVYKEHRCTFDDASVAFMTRHAFCKQYCDGVIDGRWHVQHYTI